MYTPHIFKKRNIKLSKKVVSVVFGFGFCPNEKYLELGV